MTDDQAWAVETGERCVTVDGETGRDAEEINHRAPRVWPRGPAQINEVRDLSRARSPKETMHHRPKASCRLQTQGRGCVRGIKGRWQIREQQEGTYRTSAAFDASLHLAITALRASPDETVTEQKKRVTLERPEPSTRGEMETWAKWNPCNSSETWHSLGLWQTGNTDEKRKCSGKCKWTCSSLFSGPQICSGWEFGF